MFGALRRLLSSGPEGRQTSAGPEEADKLIVEGNRVEDEGDAESALALYRRAASIAPNHARAHLNIGILLEGGGDGQGAASAYESVLAIDSEHVWGNYNYSRLLFLRKDLRRAESLVREALRGRPDFADALILLSNILDATGNTAAAAEALEQALQLAPASLGGWLNLTMLLRASNRSDDAELALNRAKQLDPEHVDVVRLLSLLRRDQGFAAEALALLRSAIEQEPGRFDLRSDELLLLNCIEGVDSADLFRRHAAFGAALEAAIPARHTPVAHGDHEQRRLRVGYVSGDLCIHPVALFLIPVLEHRDTEAFEVFCLSSGTVVDHVTARIQGLCDHWIDAAGMSDSDLADQVQAAGIDILVDLAGHTGRSRLPLFAERPAAVQLTWLGYLNTTGLTRIDYRICDGRTDPLEFSQALHTERLWPLAPSQWCYRPLLDMMAAPSSPVERNGYVTFGSFNSALKISPQMCGRWMELLERVPSSRLLVANVTSERKRESIRSEMARRKITEDRVSFVPRVELDDYFRLFADVDIALDSFPYGGGTTTFDALWMGVPVLTAVGSIPVSRSAASVLQALKLDAWIAPTVDDYVRVGSERAADRDALASLRRTLRQTLKDSPLTDEAGFVRELERAYRGMWIERARVQS